MKRTISLIVSCVLIGLTLLGCFAYYNYEFKKSKEDYTKEKKEDKKKQEQMNKIDKLVRDEKDEDIENIKSFKLTVAGDCTVGSDTNFGYNGSIFEYFDKNDKDYSYFFSGVKKVFEDDDITLVNLEGTFTDSDIRREKAFNFKASPNFVNVLTKGSIEVVNIANNHSHDYEEQGYNDTKNTLEAANVDYCGNSKYLIKEVNGIRVGFFGFLDIYGQRYADVKSAINYLKKENCDLIIASMHWGIEKDYIQSAEQVKMGHYLIDNGVDLVVGTHPHVIQGIEKYNNKYIIYSLANFMFGGNKNPADKDTFIFQQTFTFKNDALESDDNIRIIPASISSTRKTNDYKPTILTGDDRKRVMEKIKENSTGVEFKE